MKKNNRVKSVPCLFLLNVRCLRRRNAKFKNVDKCMDCPHFRKFNDEMDEEDVRVMDEIDDMRRKMLL